MSAARSQPSLLPFVAAQPLVDHHCHAVRGYLPAGQPGNLPADQPAHLPAGQPDRRGEDPAARYAAEMSDLTGMLNEADGPAAAGGMPFDSLAGLAFRRWCPPLLGLPPHASVDAYARRRAELGLHEVSRRFLGASGLAALCLDTGYTPASLLSAAETAGLAGAVAFEIVRLEQVAESLAENDVTPAAFPDAYREALSARVTRQSSGVPVAGFKSIAAYRVGLALDGRRPGDGEVAAAVARWLGRPRRGGGPHTPGSAHGADWAGTGSAQDTGGLGAGSAHGTGGLGAGSAHGTGGLGAGSAHGTGGLGAGSAHGTGGADGTSTAGGMGGADGTDTGSTGTPPRVADEVLHRFFIWCAADLGLPVQFHVGYGDRDIDLHRCNPLLLTGLLRALEPTGVPVMLLHNYPYHREAGYLAQVFPLVYADLGLATHNVGSRATALLGEALELVPLRKFLFSSDAFGLPELYYLGALLFRRALSAFLSDRLADGDMSYADAERITRLIGAENARRVYQLEP